MIVLSNKDTKPTSSPSGMLNLSENESLQLSFSDLLKDVDISKEKPLQNSSIVLSLDNASSDSESAQKQTSSLKEQLLSLLGSTTEVTSSEDTDLLTLNQSVTQKMSTEELNRLIADAKSYLKNQIMQSDEYKLSQAKELPKTLQGLVDLAGKLGLDISKVSIENLQNNQYSRTTVEVNEKETLQVKIPQEAIQKEVSTKSNVQKVQNVSQNLDEKSLYRVQELKSTPLFKAQTSNPELTTEQLVQTKVNNLSKPSQSASKQKADETLQLLLRGEKPQQTQSGSHLTSDFSVATARVIAPSSSTDSMKNLEALLKGESDSKVDTQSTSSTKVDALNVPKAESLEVKLNEAKQMVKYLSSDVKTAIDDYKSPFTRVKVQLNPQKLGEIELTVVQRGKNLHVNLSSNNTAIHTLAMNANELKVQLSNNGINNASLNFTNNSDGGNASQSGGNQHNGSQAQKEYESFQLFENEDTNEESLSSLEIIIPSYA